MALEQYTNTYTDIDSNIFDSDDLVAEFNRVAYYINLWAASVGSGGIINTFEQRITTNLDVVSGSPSNGILQKLIISNEVEEIAINFTSREEGDPYRIYISLRFQNKDSVFTVSGPSGETNMFAVNREEFSPSQVSAGGYYTAMLTATYGKDNGVMIGVFADNQEVTTVETDDTLTVVAI
jgi:hypothetical protein